MSTRLIMKVLSRMVPFHVKRARSNALYLLRSKWCNKLVGAALAAHAKRLILKEIADLLASLHTAVDSTVRQELVAALEHK